MTKILVIFPINHDKLNQGAQTEIDTLKISDLKCVITNLSRGPEFIENRYDNYKSYDELIERSVQAEKDGYDGIYIDVFTDAAVYIIRELVKIPVLGGFAPSLLTANAISQKYSIITALPDVVPIYESLSRQLGQQNNLVSIRHVDTKVCNMSNISSLTEHLLKESKSSINDGAHAIVLGCTGMLGVSKALEQELSTDHCYVPVINPTLSGICMLYGLIHQGLRHSQLTYSYHL